MFNKRKRISLKKILSSNVRIINLTRVLRSTIILWPVLTLIYLSKGISFFEIGLINSIGSIVITILEVPLGMLADKFGRKPNLILGYSLHLVFILCLSMSSSIFELIITEIIFSIATCLISGTDISIVYDSLKKDGKEEEYTEIISKNNSLVIFISIFISVISMYIYGMNAQIVYVWAFLVYFLMLVASIYIKEEKTFEERIEPNLESKIKQKNIFAILSRYKIFILISLFSSLIILLVSNLSQLASPILMENGMKMEYTGYIVAISKIFSIVLLRNRSKFSNIIKSNIFVFLTGVIAVVLAMLLVLDSLIYWIIVICLVFSINDFLQPIISKKINDSVNSKNRTTMLSISSLLDNALFFVGDPVLGYGIDLRGYNYSFGMFGLVLFLVLLVFYVFKKRKIN